MTDPGATGEIFKSADPLGDGVGYVPVVEGMWRRNDSVLFLQRLPPHVVSGYGGASELWQRFDFAVSEQGAPRSLRVNVTHWAFNKTATRTTESWWMRFQGM